MKIRKAYFSGSWYPSDPEECEKFIHRAIATTPECNFKDRVFLGGIVPHAGWVFSGRIACKVIHCLKGEDLPDTIIIFGRHLHPQSPNFIMKEGAWDTPFGELKVDSVLAEELCKEFSFNIETHISYEPDNTIELQLPFIKYFFPHSMILPLGLPPKKESLEIGKRAVQIGKEIGRDMIIIGSTDLTHYGYNYGFIPKGVGEEALRWVKEVNDRRVIERMIEMDAEAVIEEAMENQNACCSGAAASAISALRELGCNKGYELIYSTSYDIRPDSSFVGYVGILFY